MRKVFGPALAALLGLTACGQSPAETDRAEANKAAPDRLAQAAPDSNDAAQAEAQPPAASQARAKPVAPGAAARRCGWLVNPTPANWWLVDRDGQWILGTQGADQAPGMDEMPDMSTAGWVETNGHYGHGCACMTITADGDGRVTRVADARPKPLSQCRADRKLPRPE